MSSTGAAVSSSQFSQMAAQLSGGSKAEERRYAEWLLSQAMRRDISLEERRWLDQYLWRCRGECRSTRSNKGSAGPLVFCWILAILASGAVAVASWLN